MIPISGKNGYLRSASGVEIPIFLVNASTLIQRTAYRTAATDNYLNRTRGLLSENIIIRGVHCPEYISNLWNNYEFNGELGWIDWANNRRVYIELNCVVVRNVIELRYTAGSEPSISWSVNLFERGDKYKEFKYRSIAPLDDTLFCPNASLCSRPVYTTDLLLLTQALVVKHITRATITKERELSNYATARTLPRTVSTPGVKEKRLDLTVQGDFDYWYKKVNWSQYAETPDDYKFYYGSGVNEYILVDKMRALELSDLIINVQTAEMVSATVRLGSAR